MGRLRELPAFADGPLAARKPELKVRRARRRPNRLGFAVPSQFRLSVTAYPGIRAGDILETLLHELVHLHVGRAAEPHAWHGATFKMRGATGRAPRSRVLACIGLVVLGIATAPFSLLAAVIASSAVLVAVAIDDTRAEPNPLSPPAVLASNSHELH